MVGRAHSFSRPSAQSVTTPALITITWLSGTCPSNLQHKGSPLGADCLLHTAGATSSAAPPPFSSPPPPSSTPAPPLLPPFPHLPPPRAPPLRPSLVAVMIPPPAAFKSFRPPPPKNRAPRPDRLNAPRPPPLLDAVVLEGAAGCCVSDDNCGGAPPLDEGVECPNLTVVLGPGRGQVPGRMDPSGKSNEDFFSQKKKDEDEPEGCKQGGSNI